MKKIVLVFAFLVSFATATIAQWEWVNPKPQGNHLSDIYLFNSDTILAVGDAGTVIKSVNKGDDWTSSFYVAHSDYLVTLTFLNENVGYAVAAVGILYKTIDGGENWTYVRNFYNWILSIKFVNENIGFMCGNGGILKTTDGGLNWSPKPISGSNFRSLDFINNDIGWVVGLQGSIFKTTDEGENWTTQTSNSTNSLLSVKFIDDQIGIAVGENGAIVKTINGGGSWSIQNSGVTDNLNCVTCIDQNYYIAVGKNGTIIRTTNGGVQWTPISSSTYVHFSTIKAFENNIYIVGDYGFIFLSTDGGINWLEKSSAVNRSNFRGMSMVENNFMWVVGDNGSIVHSSDMGSNWENQNSGISNDLYSVDFVDSNTGWAVGMNGAVIHTTDAGITWIPQQLPAVRNLLNVDFYDNNFGIAVGEYRTIFMTSNGGNTWLDRTTGSAIEYFYDVFISSSNLIWTVSWDGGNSKVYRSTDGITWIPLGVIPQHPMRSVFFLNPLVGFVCGDGIYKTSDGGLTWNFKGGGYNTLFSIYFLNENIGWACGRDGSIFRTIDGGNTWSSFYYYNEKATSNYLYSIYFINELKGFAIGTGGTIIKTENASPTPVELTSFTASINQNITGLYWSTATELNNLGFEIERSIDKTSWATIGFREGKGTTSEPQDYTYSDDISEISSSKLYYRLKQIDFNGSFEYSKIVEVEIAPSKFALQQNYPNPFNPSTNIQYAISSLPTGQAGTQFVTVKVYDVLGKEIATLLNEEKSAGSYETDFNASHLASGIYYYQLRAGDYVETKKMILLK